MAFSALSIISFMCRRCTCAQHGAACDARVHVHKASSLRGLRYANESTGMKRACTPWAVTAFPVCGPLCVADRSTRACSVA